MLPHETSTLTLVGVITANHKHVSADLYRRLQGKIPRYTLGSTDIVETVRDVPQVMRHHRGRWVVRIRGILCEELSRVDSALDDISEHFS